MRIPVIRKHIGIYIHCCSETSTCRINARLPSHVGVINGQKLMSRFRLNFKTVIPHLAFFAIRMWSWLIFFSRWFATNGALCCRFCMFFCIFSVLAVVSFCVFRRLQLLGSIVFFWFPGVSVHLPPFVPV